MAIKKKKSVNHLEMVKKKLKPLLKNKKLLIGVGGAAAAIILFLIIFNLNPVKIVKSENKTIKYQAYNNGLIKLSIPSGWRVTTLGDYIHYTFLVSDPTNQYKVFYNLKSENYYKSEAARNFMIKYYGSYENSYGAVLSNQSTYGFYKIFNKLGEYNNNSTFTFPVINDFTVIENLGKTVFGGDLLRASFTDNNKKYEGLFTAKVYNPGNYYVNSNPFDFRSKKVDTYPLNVYNTIFISGPEAEFYNYSEVLNHVIGSLEFTDSFMSGFNAQQDSILSTIRANSKVYNEVSDMIMSSWEKRNNSYDIISQKQSDATLGYSRVYDKENGEIYKAYNGFLDDYKGDRYEAVTDDMYTDPISGYIEK